MTTEPAPAAPLASHPSTERMPFGDLFIAFDERVLRPREWTTAQSRWAAEMARTAPPGDVLELCAGAGQIGLLAVAESTRRLVAVDVDPVAAAYARHNAAAAGIADRVDVRVAPLEEALAPGEQFPVVVADPPWVRSAETGRFPEDPPLAIDGGEDGTDLARRCLTVIDAHLAPGGVAVLQLGTREQVDRLAERFLPQTALRVGEVREFARGALVTLARDGEAPG